MYARVTLLDIDPLRATVADALEKFRAQTLERLREQLGYRGVWVLATAEGKALMMATVNRSRSRLFTTVRLSRISGPVYMGTNNAGPDS